MLSGPTHRLSKEGLPHYKMAAEFLTNVKATIDIVDQALAAYQGAFKSPVEVRVLRLLLTLIQREPLRISPFSDRPRMSALTLQYRPPQREVVE